MKRMLIVVFLGASLLAGCAPRNTASVGGTNQRLAEIARVYEHEFSGNPNRQIRKPRVDARNRAMREIAELAASELTATPKSPSDAQLVSVGEAATLDSPMAEFHAALAALQSAADHRQVAAVHREYARVMAAHSKLTTAGMQ